MKVKLNIEAPCTANWNAMIPNADGKYCSLCQKNVIDFTDWSTNEIAQYLATHASERTCGRVRKTHLEETTAFTESLTPIINWNTSNAKRVAVLVVVSLGLAITSCNDTSAPPSNNIPIIQVDTLKSDSIQTPSIDVQILGGLGLAPLCDTNNQNPSITKSDISIIAEHTYPESFETGEMNYIELPDSKDSLAQK